MDISISTTIDFNIPLEVMIPMIAQAGFRSISLAGGNYDQSQYLRAQGRQRIKMLCKGNNIGIDSIHAPLGSGIDISHPEQGIREYSVDLMRQSIDACVEVGCYTLMLHLCNRFPDTEIGERIIAVRDSLRRISSIAQQWGVNIALENLVAETTYVLFHQMLVEFKDTHIGVCYDTSHAHLAGNMYQLLETYGTRIIAVHISDNRGQLDDHMLPFEGTIDWDRFMQAFKGIHFRGTLLLEVEMRESQFKDPRMFLQQASMRARKLLALINQQ